MKRVIYSLYIDIPEKDLDWQPPHHGHNHPKTLHTKEEFQLNWEWLTSKQKEYADSVGVDYRLFEYDEQYIKYRDWFLEEYPQITHYNIVNFYKIHQLYELSKEYDEILYLDLDVVPFTTDNFFEAFDLQENVAIMEGLSPSQRRFPTSLTKLMDQCNKTIPSIRSPCAKYWNAIAMQDEFDIDHDENFVFNTGIIGISKKHIEQLDYFGNFHETLTLMDAVKEDPSWTPNMRKMFGWDNETIWAHKTKETNIPWVRLGYQWHHFMDKEDYIPPNAKLVHVVNKHFSFVKEHLKNAKTTME